MSCVVYIICKYLIANGLGVKYLKLNGLMFLAMKKPRLGRGFSVSLLLLKCITLGITNVPSGFLVDVVWFVWFRGILGGLGA